MKKNVFSNCMDDYESQTQIFQLVCVGIILYVKEIWLSLNNGSGANAWTNQVMHLGKITINKAKFVNGYFQKIITEKHHQRYEPT